MPLGGSEEAHVNDGALESPPARIWRKMVRLPLSRIKNLSTGSPRESVFGGLQSCQNGRLGGAAVTAKVRTLNSLSLELPCASWRLQLGEKHVSPRENAFLEASKAAKMAVWEAHPSRQRSEP